MANFDKEFDKVVEAEGVYSNDKNDSGGETYLGIARNFNKNWKGWTVVDNIKKQVGNTNLTKALKANTELKAEAKKYYKDNYWDVLELDDVPNQSIAHELFDTCVNMGQSAAIKIAQQVLGMSVTGKWSEALKYNLVNFT